MDYLADLFGVIGRALRLDPLAVDAAEYASEPWAIPIGIVVLAVVSQSIGQALILAINEVRGKRLAVTLTAAVAGTILGYVVLGTALAATGTLVLGHAPDTRTLIQAVMVSAAPLVLGFLVLLPYSGPAVGRMLQLWSLLVLWGIVAYEFGVDRWIALVLTAIAWLVQVVVTNLAGRPLGFLRDKLWFSATGRRLSLTSQRLLDEFPLPPPEEGIP